MNAFPRGRLLFDTSAYVGQIRHQRYPWLARERGLFQRTILTVVVAAELYAGTRSRKDKRSLDALCRAHEALSLFSCPPREAWITAGMLLGRYRSAHGAVRFADHFRDVMIALEAARHAATLVTENARDFSRWQRLLRSSGQRLNIFDLAKISES